MVPKITKANGHIVQADWNQTDPLKMDYIHNKPEIPDISDVIKSSAQNLTEDQKTQARTNIDAAAPSEITSQVTALSNQLYDENYGTETGMSIRYIAGQVVDNEAVSLNNSTRKDDFDFTCTNGTWNISPVGNYYGARPNYDLTIEVNGMSCIPVVWSLKGVEIDREQNLFYQEVFIYSHASAPAGLVEWENDLIRIERFSNKEGNWSDWHRPLYWGNSTDLQNVNGTKQIKSVPSFYSDSNKIGLQTAITDVSIPTSSYYAYSIPQRDVNGDLHVLETPIADTSATCKKYVDEQVQGAKDASIALPWATHQFRQIPTFPINSKTVEYKNVGSSSNSATADAIPMYIASTSTDGDTIPAGCLITNTPTRIAHAANKQYVDEQVQAAKDASVPITTVSNKVYCTNSSGNQSTRTITSSPTAGAIPVYGTNGILSVGTPTANSSAANKKYVDDSIANAPRITEQTKLMTDVSAASDGVGLTSLYALDSTHITFEAVPLAAKLPDAGFIFTTGSTSTVYRRLDFYLSDDIGAPFCKGTLVDGTVSYFQPPSTGKVAARVGPVLAVITISPLTTYTS